MYKHKVQYYETDKMGITHHSNYLRFMEEARTSVLEKAGFSYKKMEENKIFIPVVSATINYKKPTTYGDIINIDAKVISLSPAKLQIHYEMSVKNDIVCTAETCHCFLNENSRPVAVKKTNPEIYEVFEKLLKEEE